MTARWPLALFGFAITAAFWPGIAAAATSPRWAVAAIGSALLLFCAGPIRLTIAHLAGALFLGWCLATLSWSWSPDALDAAFKLGILAACFCLGSVSEDLEPLWLGAGVGIAVSSVIAIAQVFGFAPVPYLTIPAGLFINGNYMAEAAVLVLIGLAASGRWWMAAACLPAATLGVARGALLALAAAAAAWLWGRSRAAALALVLLVAVSGATMGFYGWRSTHVAERVAFWRDTASGITLTGHGLGSFRDVFTRYAEHTDLRRSRPAQPHNEALGIAFELGIVGLVLFLIFAATLFGPLRPQGLVLIAVAVEAMFAQPLHLPVTGALGCLVAGHIARGVRDARSAALRCGILLRAGLGRFGRA